MRKLLLSGHSRMLALLLLAMFSFVLPQQVFPQTAGLSFSMQNATLKEIINEIQRISDFDFVYSDEDIKDVPGRTVDFSNATISAVLDHCLSGTAIEARINGKTIVFRKRASRQSQGSRPISGKVTDQAGNPLENVSVSVKGTTTGMLTDENGAYRLNVPAEDVTLTFSYLGMNTLELVLDARRNVLDVSLQESTNTLDNVIVTGMFDKARESYTGAVSEISGKEIQLFRGQNLVRTLANIDPSINLVRDNYSGSDPNQQLKISIRGKSSLPMSITELNETGAAAHLNTPLIIMDGFEISLQKLADFNDEDVERITILKDASAVAIYGSRGANGVIVITTKRPSEGKLRIQFQASLNLEIPDLTSYDLLNAREKLELERVSGVFDNNSAISYITLQKEYSKRLEEVNRGVDTYWLSKPLRVGAGQKYNLRMDWGAKEFQITAAVGYNNIMGVMKGSQRNIFNGSITMAYQMGDILFRNQTSVDLNKSNNSKYGSFKDYVNMNQYWRTHDEHGNLIKTYDVITGTSGGVPYFGTVGNPLYNATLNSLDQIQYDQVINNFSIEWKITDGLVLRGSLGLSKLHTTSDYFLPPGHTDFERAAYATESGQMRKGRYDYTVDESFNIDGNLTLSYSKAFAERHQLYAGINYYLSDREGFGYEFKTEGFANESFNFLPNALQYAEGTIPTGSESVVRSVSFTGNVNYTYDNRYFVDASYRLDGSSLYGAKNKFAPFWSLAVGWNLHNEKFLSDVDFVTRLRLRGSIGETGSQSFSAYQALSTLKYMEGQKYISWVGAELMGLGNENLKWQTTPQQNIGIDAEFLDGRLNFSVDIYSKKTKDLLSSMELEKSTGFDNYVENIGEVENRGLEASLGYYIIRDTKRELIWSVNTKIDYNKNTISKLSDEIKKQTAERFEGNNQFEQLLFEGDPVNAIYAVPSLGIDPSTGREIFLDKDGNVTSTWNPNAKRFYGTSDPQYRGNFSTYLSYKNFSLNLSFAYYWGGQQYNETLLNRVEVPNADLQYNVDGRVYTDRWQKPGDVKFFKGYGENATRTYVSSRFVMDDNVFELQSASLMYTFDRTLLKKLGIESLRLSLNMSDIFHLSSIKRERGIDYPFSRKATVGVSLTF